MAEYGKSRFHAAYKSWHMNQVLEYMNQLVFSALRVPEEYMSKYPIGLGDRVIPTCGPGAGKIGIVLRRYDDHADVIFGHPSDGEIHEYFYEDLGFVPAQPAIPELRDSDGTPIDTTGWRLLNSCNDDEGKWNCRLVMCEECPLNKERCHLEEEYRGWFHYWSGERGVGKPTFQRVEMYDYQRKMLEDTRDYKTVYKGRSVGCSSMLAEEALRLSGEMVEKCKELSGTTKKLPVSPPEDYDVIARYDEAVEGLVDSIQEEVDREALVDIAEAHEKARQVDRIVGVRFNGLLGHYKLNEHEEPHHRHCIACLGAVPGKLATMIREGDAPCPLCGHDKSKCPCGGTIYKGWDSREGRMRDRCMRCGDWRQS